VASLPNSLDVPFSHGPEICLTGATGFVGRYLYPALSAAGYSVRCMSRRPDRASQRLPGRRWMLLDMDQPASLSAALDGCEAAFYLIHGMNEGKGYAERERRHARAFAGEAARAGVHKVIYLGGVMPPGAGGSAHLCSRRLTGQLLQQGAAPAIELRAAMIIGAGSASWLMVRDLASRLPAMVLPRWLSNSSYPIAIDDVIHGLMTALSLLAQKSRCYELPGPERVTHQEMLKRAALELGHRPIMVNVPMLTPRLSSYWIGLVTRASLNMARELVEGAHYNLEPTGVRLWERCDHKPMSVHRAIQIALDDERDRCAPGAGAVQRLAAIGRRYSVHSRP
jgi:uncharacterized protein YbjT (DUF2867 family)